MSSTETELYTAHNGTGTAVYSEQDPDEEQADAREVKKRVRTGCFNCRKKHKKCDEQKPVCKACEVRSEQCEWPSSSTNRNKRRRTGRTTTNFKSTSTVALQAINNYTRNLETLDNTLTTETTHQDHWMSVLGNGIESPENSYGYGAGRSHSKSSVSSGISPDAHAAARQTSVQSGASISSQLQVHMRNSGQASTGNAGVDFSFDLNSPSVDFNLIELEDLKNTLRDYMFANALHMEMDTNNGTLQFEVPEFNLAPLSPSDAEVSFLTREEEKMLMKVYLYKVAPWLDMFDLSRQFGLQTTQLSKMNKGLRYAILAVSARQKENTDQSYDPCKSKILYEHSLRHLIPFVKSKPDVATISTCVLLCVIDMMSITPDKWRYHIEGCAALFKATGINGFSSKFESALFWCFARMDVNSGVIGDQGTMIESERWLPLGVSIYDAREVFVKEGSVDMYANYMVFLCSRVLNLIASESTKTFDIEFETLWKEIDQWYDERPEQMKAIIEFDSTPFPEVLYDNGPAISSNQLYHMAVILLYHVRPRSFKTDHYKPATWHVRQICAISIHNDHHGCWNNAVQPLFVAGRLLTHKEEHAIVLDLLETIEATTGWSMKFRADDLRDYWARV